MPDTPDQTSRLRSDGRPHGHSDAAGVSPASASDKTIADLVDEELKRHLDHAAEAIHWVASDGTILWANATELDWLGYRRDEYVGHHIAEFHVDRPTIDDILARLTRGEILLGHEARLRRRDGAVRDVQINSNVLWRDGQFLHTRCFTRDVTERKRIEGMLGDGERQYRALANSMPNLAWMAKPDGWIYWFNDQWYAYTGTTPADMEGWGWQSVHDPIVLASVTERWRRSIETGTPFEMVFPLRGADGQFRRFLTRVNPVRDAHGQVVHWFGTNTDVETERLATEANVVLREREESARLQVEATNRAKDEFLAMLGHELRNPLSPILTALQLMKLRGADGSERERVIIERQVTHLTRLIDDLLDVSRIAGGKVELKEEIIEIAEVVAKALETAGALLEQRLQTLTVDVPHDNLAVKGDPTRLTQIVSNLLTNAAKYTSIGGRIAVRADEDRGDVVLRIVDSGIGIAPDMLPRIFDLFVQERQAIDRAQGGLGLGLTIVRNLVERHGGSVSARSDGAGCGSEFIVRLPRVKAARRIGSGKPRLVAPAAPAMARSDAVRILIVDDNEDGAEMLAAALTARGFHTSISLDASSAVSAAENFSPSIALLDIGLPVMDGYELADRLRAAAGLEDIRLIALTGFGQESDRQKTRDAGFDHHLVKPVDLQVLEKVIAELLVQPQRRATQ